MSYQGFFFSLPNAIQNQLQEVSKEISWKSINHLDEIKDIQDSFVICFHQDFNIAENQQLFSDLQKKINATIVFFMPPLNEICSVDFTKVYKVSDTPDKFDIELLLTLVYEDLNIQNPNELQLSKKAFKATIFSKIATLFTLLNDWPNNLESLKTFVQTLATSTKSYAFNEVTQLCQDLETALKECLENKAPIEQEIVKQKCIAIKEAFLKKSPPESPPPADHPESSPNLSLKDSVYIITNDDILYDLLEYGLTLRGIPSARENSGANAYTTLKNTFMNSPPFAILLDDNLDDEDPILTLESIKTIIHDQIPIIYISSKGREADIFEGLDRGASGYITKPFSLGVLLHKIATKKL